LKCMSCTSSSTASEDVTELQTLLIPTNITRLSTHRKGFQDCKQMETDLPMLGTFFLHSKNCKILHSWQLEGKVTWLLQVTHFSMKKPGCQGCSGASSAGLNMRWPSLVGPNGVEGGLT
jgi:hypothetical protein